MATATYPPMPTRRKTDTSDALCRRSTSQGGSQCLRFASLSKRAITRAPLVQGQPERVALPRTDQRRSLPSPFPSLLRVCQWQLSRSYCAPYQATRPPCRDPLSVLTGRLTGAAKRGAWVEPIGSSNEAASAAAWVGSGRIRQRRFVRLPRKGEHAAHTRRGPCVSRKP